MKNVLLIFMACLLCLTFMACEESEEGVDDNNDIIVRNFTDFDLWIMINGVEIGHIDDDGIAKTMWDGIQDGTHFVQAFYSNSYTNEYCRVQTDWLDDGEDFAWYLEDGFEYSGTKTGNCP